MFVFIILMEFTSYFSGKIKNFEEELTKAKENQEASQGIYYHSFNILQNCII